MSIKIKILSGYIIIALLTSFTTLLSQQQLSKIQNQFIEMEAFSKEIRDIDRIEEKVWETRYLVDRFLRLNHQADGNLAKKNMKDLRILLERADQLHRTEQQDNSYRSINELLHPYEVKFSNLGLRVNYLSRESERLTRYALTVQRHFDQVISQRLPIKIQKKLFRFRNDLSEVSILSAQLFFKYEQQVVEQNIKTLNETLTGLEMISNSKNKLDSKRLELLMFEIEEYRDSFEGAMSVIRKIDEEIKTTLDPIAPQIVDKVKQLDIVHWDKELEQNATLSRDIGFHIERVLFLSISILILGIVLGILFSKRLTQPIVSLQKNALQLSKGDLEQVVEIDSNDELGSLAHSFNVMRDSIRKRLEDLKELNALGEQLLIAKSADDILNSVIEILSEKTGIHSGFIHLFDSEVDQLQENLKKKYQCELVQSIETYLENTILNEALNEQVVHILPKDELYSKIEHKTHLLVPLRYGKEVVGLLVLIGEEGSVLTHKGDEEFIKGAGRTILAALRRIQMLDIIKSKNESLKKANRAKDGLLIRLKGINNSLEDIVEQRTSDLSKALLDVKVASQRVTSSIKYARRIQNSVLPDLNQIRQVTQDSFFIWKPRDIVGGDFYYSKVMKDGYIVAVVDCTGHGVPGAFMTMLTVSGLKKIITDEEIIDPAEICYRLNIFIKEALHQDSSHATSNDGLDAAICYIDTKKQKLRYAGARLPLLYIKDDELQFVKPDRESIGYKSSRREPVFTNKEVDIEEGMSIYMYSDGMIDQLGGEKRTGFGKRRLHEVLNKNRHKSLEEQKDALLHVFNEFQGENIRQDDVTVVGIRI